MKVFISHISEESKLASVLKEWIEKAFLGQIEVFVSSHDITSGEQWFTRLEAELVDAKVMLVLCSATSVAKPWINFETGAGHIKGIPIVPICHSGMTVDTLPKPLLFFQGLVAEHEELSSDLMKDLAKHLGFKKQPLVPHQQMSSEVTTILSTLKDQTSDPDLEEKEEEVEQENGYIDQLVVFLDNMDGLTNLISLLGSESSKIATETSKFTNQVVGAGTNKSQSTPQHIQKLARQYSTKLDAYADKIMDLNGTYSDILPKIDRSLHSVIEYQSPQTDEDWKSIEEFKSILDDTETSISDMKTQAISARDTINAVPNFQRDLRKAIRKTVQQYDMLIGNINRNIEMILKMKVALTSLERSRFSMG